MELKQDNKTQASIKVIITGATGMIGKGVLLECLDNKAITQVLVINRSTVGISHPKLKEILYPDFSNFDLIKKDLKGYDAVYFCLGISANGLKEAQYRTITYDYTINFAKAVLEQNTNLTFIYVSGQGTDSSEKSRMMWARVKGATENALLKMPFKQAYMFRPGIIQPMRGIQSRTKWYNTIYKIIKPIWPLFRAVMGNKLTNTDNIGEAMINAVTKGYHKQHLSNADINDLSRK